MAAFFVLLAASSSPAPSLAKGIVSGTASVIDGDTIVIHGKHIRLFAIDAVESRQRCHLPGGKNWNCGKDAAFALADRIGRSPISCAIRDVDRYGRLVGVCRLGKTDLNAWMVSNGWAVAYRRYGLDYVDEEREAQRQHRGIWKSQFMMPWDWRHR